MLNRYPLTMAPDMDATPRNSPPKNATGSAAPRPDGSWPDPWSLMTTATDTPARTCLLAARARWNTSQEMAAVGGRQ